MAVGSDNRAAPMPKEALASLLGFFAPPLRCVFLNACYTHEQALLIAANIDVVIGSRRELAPDSAVAFAASFYQAIAFGLDVRRAFELARANTVVVGAATPAFGLAAREGVDAGALRLHVDGGEPDAGPRHDAPEDRLLTLINALDDLFRLIFGLDELRYHMRRLGTEHLLPQPPATMLDVSFAAASMLVKKQLLSSRWFKSLVNEIPRRRSDIMRVADLWMKVMPDARSP